MLAYPDLLCMLKRSFLFPFLFFIYAITYKRNSHKIQSDRVSRIESRSYHHCQILPSSIQLDLVCNWVWAFITYIFRIRSRTWAGMGIFQSRWASIIQRQILTDYRTRHLCRVSTSIHLLKNHRMLKFCGIFTYIYYLLLSLWLLLLSTTSHIIPMNSSQFVIRLHFSLKNSMSLKKNETWHKGLS